MHKLKVKMKPGSFPILGTIYTACIGGCDQTFNEMMDIRNENIRRVVRPNDSGYGSGTRSTNTGTSGSSSRSSTTSSASRGSSASASRANTSGTARGRSSGGSRTNGANVGNVGLPAAANRRPASNSAQGNFKRPATVNAGVVIENRNNSFPTWGTIDNDVAVLCECNERAVQRTVTKDGPNKGLCSRRLNVFLFLSNLLNTFQSFWRGGSRHPFFISIEFPPSRGGSYMNPPITSLYLLFISGRQFYVCGKPRDVQCRFFLWGDDTDGQTGSNNAQSWPNNNAQTHQPRPPRPNGSNPPPPGGAPACVCGQPAVE